MDDQDHESSLRIQQEAAIDQFCSVTGSNEETARNTLEACNWNLELAINMHVDSIDTNDPVEVPVPETNTSNIQVPNQSSASSTDEVRAPIPPKRQVLVEDSYAPVYRNIRQTGASSSSVFDAFRDFQAEARWHEELQREQAEPSSSVVINKRRTLADLFSPPLELLHRGTMDSAREEGAKLNKWLMVNVQNVQEFSCQILNRDVWSNTAVKSIITEHFVFWQVYHDTADGQRYMQFYNVTDFPHVAILDPRTGERLRSWSTIDSVSFCDLVTEFLIEHPSPNGSSTSHKEASYNNVDKMEKQNSDKPAQSPYEDSEEMQLKAAIAASLQETNVHNHNTNNSIVNNDDSDNELETFDTDSESSKSPEAQNLIEETKNNEQSNISNDNKHLEESIEDWKNFLGPDNGQNSELIIRFPDGQREQMSFPAKSQLKALFLYLLSRGYSMEDYDLITNFPKRNLLDLSSTATLSEVGLYPRETVFLQLKS